jgi:hypothetical protein
MQVAAVGNLFGSVIFKSIFYMQNGGDKFLNPRVGGLLQPNFFLNIYKNYF